MTYTEMKDAVINALTCEDIEELKHLEQLDGRWYEDIMEELEANDRFEMVIVWDTGEKEISGYRTETEAKQALSGMYMAFGRQVWGCVRRKIDRKGV